MNIFMMEYINNNDEYNIYIYEYMHISYIYWIYYIQLSQRINEEHIHQYSNIEISGLVIPHQFWLLIPKENCHNVRTFLKVRWRAKATSFLMFVPRSMEWRHCNKKNRPNGRSGCCEYWQLTTQVVLCLSCSSVHIKTRTSVGVCFSFFVAFYIKHRICLA